MSIKLLMSAGIVAALCGCRAHARVGPVHAGGGVGYNEAKQPRQVAEAPKPDPAPQR